MTKQSLQTLMQQADNAGVLAVEGAKLDFALGLARLLERASLSRSDLASRLGVSLPMVTKILRGDTNLTIETMVKAARAAQGMVHINLAAEGSQCRWFEVLNSERRRHPATPATHVRPQTSKMNLWNLANTDETESIAA
jgi:transcriptional regulator with XRE-family HTH domain